MKVLKAALVSVLLTSGAAQAATIDLTRNSTQASTAMLYAEQSEVSIRGGSTTVDYLVGTNLAVGETVSGIDTQNGGEDLTAGTYSSFLIHFDPNGSGMTEGSFNFLGKIVAVILSNGGSASLLNDSDGMFGDFSNYTYEDHLGRRAESSDSVTLVDSNTLGFKFSTNSQHIDNVRVITEVAVVPLPASMSFLMLGLGALTVMRRRK